MSQVSPIDDVEALVLASRSGDQAAWAQLVDRLSPLVWSVARSYGLDRHDAVDVSQTTWLQFARHVASIAEPRKAPGWLATTARRECIRMVKSSRRETPTPSSALDWGVDDQVDREVEADSERRLIWDVVNELPENCRVLVKMFLVDPPPSYETVADALQISVNAVGPKRSRCLGGLRTLLKERINASTGGES
jgi:RNA polymerase sigma factor (sigma-70 family)